MAPNGALFTVNPTGQAALPRIGAFTVAQPQVNLGDQVRLRWSVENADSIEIRSDQGDLIVQTKQLSGNVIDIPTASTTYILTASGPSCELRATLSIGVGAPPPGLQHC